MKPYPPLITKWIRCPRCLRPKVGLRHDGRLASHRYRRFKSSPPGPMEFCPASGRMPENARLVVSPLRLLGIAGFSPMTERDRRAMRADAVLLSSAIYRLEYDGETVSINFTGGFRLYTWDCGLSGWQLLWKCYRTAARNNGGKFSLGRAVTLWRSMPSIRRAAVERVRDELATDAGDGGFAAELMRIQKLPRSLDMDECAEKLAQGQTVELRVFTPMTPPPCPTHGKGIAPAGADCLVCDCRWLLENGCAEDPQETARDLKAAVQEAEELKAFSPQQ